MTETENDGYCKLHGWPLTGPRSAAYEKKVKKGL